MENEKVYQMSFAKIYPLLVNKAVRKGRTAEEVNEVITWLTGYSEEALKMPEENQRSYLRCQSRRHQRAPYAGNQIPG